MDHSIKKITHIKKWGNGSGILLPKTMMEMLSIEINDTVGISIQGNSILITPLKKPRKTLEERFLNCDGKQCEEYWTDEPLGKEVI